MALTATPPIEPKSSAVGTPGSHGIFGDVRDRILEVKELLVAILAVAGVLGGVLAQLTGFVDTFAQDPLRWTVAGAGIVCGLLVLGVAMMRVRQRPGVLRIRGLLPYDRDDPLPARDRAVKEFSELLTRTSFRLFALSGPPGCGKTSLIRAGLLPRLDSSELIPVCIEQTGLDPSGSIAHELPALEVEPEPASFVELVLAAG